MSMYWPHHPKSFVADTTSSTASDVSMALIESTIVSANPAVSIAADASNVLDEEESVFFYLTSFVFPDWQLAAAPMA